MKSKVKYTFMCLISISILLLGALPFSFADQVSVPGGPFVTPEQKVVTSSIITYPEMVKELYSLRERSKGRLEIVEIGKSYEGRTLYGAIIGKGNIRMWIHGRIHGGEKYGAEACLSILKTLVAGGSNAKDVLEKMTFMIIPIYNPDGSERNIRGTLLSDDLNREWGHLELFEEMAEEWGIPVPPQYYEEAMQSPETQAYWYAWADFRPHYVMDFHHQGTYYVEDTNLMTTVSIGIPGNPLFYSKQDPEIFAGSSKMAIIAYDALISRGYANPTRYPMPDVGFNRGMPAGVPVSVPGPNGQDSGWASSAMFIENRGGIGQKSSGYIINSFVGPTWAIIDAIVSGEITEADPARFWTEVPFRPDSIRTSDKFPQKFD
jgi:hypothetical protein